VIPTPLLQQTGRAAPVPADLCHGQRQAPYGFPSPDSDFDLRGAHVLPLREVVGLQTGPETIERSGIRAGLEIDLVTDDARKFFGLLLKKNGYVLEQVLSPLIVQTTPEHAELREIRRPMHHPAPRASLPRFAPRSGSSSRRRTRRASNRSCTRIGYC